MADDVLSAVERKRNYHTLDALRGIAAIAVAALHYRNVVAPIQASGAYRAVDLFFLMSGFVIAHAYERRFDRGMTAGGFMLVRVCRLYPLYALATAIAIAGTAGALLAGIQMRWTWPSLALTSLTSVLMLPSIPVASRDPDLYPFNNPAWSLGFEMLVNGAYAATYPWLRRRRLAVVIGVSAIGLLIVASINGNLDGGFRYPSIDRGLLRTLFSFSSVWQCVARTAPADGPRRESRRPS